MATRTLTGSRPVTNSPYLELDVTDSSQEVANNRTRVNLKLYLRVTHSISYRAIYTGKLQGSSFTANRTISSPGRYLLHETNIWVNHNSDGTKTQNFSGSYNIQITWSGKWISSLSVSGNVTLPRIPRTSTLTSASISSLSANSSATLSIGRTVHSSSFYHLVTILDGSTWVWDPGYVKGSPPTSMSLNSTTVNKMLNSMGSATSKTFRVRLRTYTGSGGSGYIGESIRNVTVSVHSSVAPTASGMSVSINGSGHDKTINKYVQNISRVTASFNSSAGYGASIASQSIVIRRSSDSSDSQTINSRSGTTGREVRSNGTYEAIGTVRDSRGRSATVRTTFTVEAYTPPSLGGTSVERISGDATKAELSYNGKWSSLGGTNRASLEIYRKLTTEADSAFKLIDSILNNTTGSLVGKRQGTVTPESYDYRVTLTDQFGRSDVALMSIGTPKVLMSFNKDLGVGFGKYHERGEVDVAGEMYVSGKLMLMPELGRPNVQIHSPDDNGHGYLELFGKDGERKAYMGIPNSTAQRLTISHENGGDVNFTVSDGGRVTVSGTPIASRGSNSLGNWVRFYDGTQICHFNGTHGGINSNSDGNGMYRSNHLQRNYPIAFSSKPEVYVTTTNDWRSWGTPDRSTETYARFVLWRAGGALEASYVLDIIAIGRWK